MAHIPTALHLKVDVDSTRATELAPRLKSVIGEALTGADRMGVDDRAGAAAYAVITEILHLRHATPAEAAIARVRALHREEYGCCAECTHESGVLWPCPTIRALDGERP
ncbi:hypothetical protein ACWDE0_21955 [Streptomyces sp. 900105755]